MYSISINMKQFKDKFIVYSDNVIVYESILINKGKFITLDIERYKYWLNEFNIFYISKKV